MTRRLHIMMIVIGCIAAPAVFVLLEAATFVKAEGTTARFVSAGIEREYILHVPPTYDPSRPAPLVISMHGAANWPAFQMRASQWNRVADEHGFLVVYPGGQGAMLKTWRLQGRSTPSRMPDVVFISELIDHVSSSYAVDSRAIYANGLSNGGGMTFVLACTLAHRIAAFGVVAAAVTIPMDWCTDTRPAPVIAFHGTADRLTPYDGGTRWIAPRPFPCIPDWTARWAANNDCARVPLETRIAPDVTRRSYRGCANAAEVLFYSIEGGGHTWPGGPPMPEWLLGKTTQSIDASREMWAFFSRHPLPAP
jgi:polyhydroxybutyrate depolymerase